MLHYLLDSSAYFRLGKSFHPLLQSGAAFRICLLQQVADEYAAESRLRSKFPWVGELEFVENRRSNDFVVPKSSKDDVKNAKIWLRDWVKGERIKFQQLNLSPPSPADCGLLAHAVIPDTVVVADDGGLEYLAQEMELPLIGSHIFIKRLLDAQLITLQQIKTAAQYLAYESDLPKNWKAHAQSLFGCNLP